MFKLRSKTRCSGFTLIELIIVITLMGAISTMVISIFARPFQMYEDTSRRAHLMTLADSALTRIDRDLRAAVPNSVRVISSGGIYSLEMIHVFTGGRYRYSDTADSTALTPQIADSQFRVLGQMDTLPAATRLVVNPLLTNLLYRAAVTDSTLGFITPSATTFTVASVGGTEEQVTLSSSFLFDRIGTGSPRKRFYFTDTLVTYRCNPSDNTIYRYINYTPLETQAISIPASSDSVLVSNQVDTCIFSYDAGNSQRNGLVTLSVTMRDKEAVRLIKQVRVSNAP